MSLNFSVSHNLSLNAFAIGSAVAHLFISVLTAGAPVAQWVKSSPANRSHCKKFVFSYTKRSVMFSCKRVLPSALHIFWCSVTRKRNATLNRNKYYSKFGVKCLNQC